MENYSRELPRGVGGGDEDEPGRSEQKMDSHSQAEELEPERRIGGGIARSSSVACIQEVAPAQPALARTNSLPMMADAEAGNKQSKSQVEPAAKLRASLSPGSGSSDGQGTPSAEGQILSSAIVPSSEGTNGVQQAEGANSTVMATASSSESAMRAATLDSGREHQDASERPATRATRSVGDVQRQRMREMPLVCTRDLPNGRRMKGILYKYKKVDELTIVCVCHGRFLTPAEFVEHAGGGQVANPLRHIDIDALSPF